VPEELYECVKCSESLPEGAFKFSSQKGGRTNVCKRCAKNRDCLRMWGKTYDQMSEEAGHRCGICGEPERATWQGVPTNLSIDHDHETLEFRGLLCRACNIQVGNYERLMKDPDLRIAIRKWIGADSDR
jgi:DNA-directed RNA polymerase subunit RPC12/RpoP